MLIGNIIKHEDEKDESNDSKDIILSYTITEPEKQALINLCRLIKGSLSSMKHMVDSINKKRSELKSLTDSEKYARWKVYLECEIDSLEERFDESYVELEELCVNIAELLEPKKCIHESFDTIVSIARNIISSDEYDITCPEEFNYNSFSDTISRFNDSYSQILRDIDKL